MDCGVDLELFKFSRGILVIEPGLTRKQEYRLEKIVRENLDLFDWSDKDAKWGLPKFKKLVLLESHSEGDRKGNAEQQTGVLSEYHQNNGGQMELGKSRAADSQNRYDKKKTKGKWRTGRQRGR